MWTGEADGARDHASVDAGATDEPSESERRPGFDSHPLPPPRGCESVTLLAVGSIDRAVSSIEGLHAPEAEKQRSFSGTALALLDDVVAACA